MSRTDKLFRIKKRWRRLVSLASCTRCEIQSAVNRFLRRWPRRRFTRVRELAVTVVTYKRPNYLHSTLNSLFAKNPTFLKAASVYVLVQGERPGDTRETEDVLAAIAHRWDVPMECVFLNSNMGCGEGFTHINRIALEKNPGYVLHLQDDWKSEESLERFLPECYRAFEIDDNLGALRLRSIQEPVLARNVVSGRMIEYHAVSENVLVGNAHFTFNPTLIRADVLHRLLPVRFEFHAQKRYHALGYDVGQLKARCFVHIGDQRVPDWKK